MTLDASQNHLLIIKDNKGERQCLLEGPEYSIGRHKECDIRLISQFVSRHHATLVQHLNEDGTSYYKIQDGSLKGNSSSNGFLINGRKLKEHNLQNQDRIVFGPHVEVIYHELNCAVALTLPPDDEDFDITLISPGMVGEPEDGELEDCVGSKGSRQS